MKRGRLFCTLLTLLVCLGALHATVSAAELHTHKICGSDTETNCGTVHASVTYRAKSSLSNNNSDELPAGNYYLTKNVTVSGQLNVFGDVRICLNGFTLQAQDGGTVFYVGEGAALTICDCVGTGKLCGSAQSSNNPSYILWNYGGTATVANCTMEGLYGVDNDQELVVIGSTVPAVVQNQYTTAPHAVFRGSVLSGLTNYYAGSDVTLIDTAVQRADGTAGEVRMASSTLEMSGGSVGYVYNCKALYLSGNAAVGGVSLMQQTQLHGRGSQVDAAYTGGPVTVSIPGSSISSYIGKIVAEGFEPEQIRLSIPQNCLDNRRLEYDAENKTHTLYADTLTASGTCGPDLYWALNSDGVLTITGTGDMYEYYPYNADAKTRVPWYGKTIKAVVIGEGCTSLCEGAFQSSGSLTQVTFKNQNPLSIGSFAFQSCSSLTDIDFGTGVLKPGHYIFQWCTALTTVHVPDTMEMNGAYSGIGSGEAMFSGCSGLLTATVDCAYIGPFMFECRNIQKITFTDPDVRFYYLENNESGHPLNVSGPTVTLVGHTCSQVQKLVNQPSYDRTLRFEAIENDQGTHGQHVVIPAEEPTCTKAGRTEGEKCANCGEIFVESTELPAAGHDWQAATCTEPKTCKSCGVTEGEAMGHSYEADWTTDEDAHWHSCTRCGNPNVMVEHTPDREKPDVDVPVRCSVCGRILQKALEYSIYDVNQDGVVNLLDVTRAQRFYGLSEGDVGWDPRADVNGDGTVSIADLILILNNYFFQ